MASRSSNNLKASGIPEDSPAGFLDAPNALSPNNVELTKGESEPEVTVPQGISILKEIFPEHGEEAAQAPKGKAPSVLQLLGSVPSPARAPLGGSMQPFGPPAHAPMPMVAPVVPPPPPLMPAPACQAAQAHWEPPRAMGQPEPAFGSYRERLRAGGRGAFQRAFDIGLVPKNMKQEWMTNGTDANNGAMGMPYGGDAQQMWNGQVQSSDYGGMAMQAQYPYVQQVPQQSPMPVQMMPQPQMQPQMQQPMQMMPMASGDQSPQMGQLQLPQMAMQQMAMQQSQMPSMGMSQAPTPTSSGASTPSGVESVRSECMAILMPQASQFSCDNDLLAAQLKASADCQCYED